jgi:hypothetical protein
MKSLMVLEDLQQIMDVIGNMKNLFDIKPYKSIFTKDKNDRDINIYKFDNVQSYGNGFYPNCFFKSNNSIINFSTEKVMSLKDVEISFKNSTDTSIDFTENTPLFYFVYNTENYYHFVYDTLPYLISYFKIKELVPNIKLLMNFPNQSDKMYRFVTEFLELLDIKDDEIFILDKNTIYNEVYVSSSYTHGHDSNVRPRNEIYELYKSIVLRAKKIYDGDINKLPKKIYISRRTWIHGDTSNIGTNYTTRRKLDNEDKLVEMLVSQGFEEVFSEKLSTIEKVILFNNVEVVVGSIGGGLCNVLFGEKDCQLICIVSPTFLSINNRFKYCFDKVRTFYYDKTFHLEEGIWKKWMRVKYKDIIGEVEEVLVDELIVSYTNEIVAGWNDKIEYNRIKLSKNECVPLDKGLNSAWSLVLDDFNLFINGRNQL